ncbi:MAG TPA: tetratricopeptide repeat protein [Longimicrobiales bacterium]|nr:tetratricopeptide repeat protein [Longimicrobiales bacterium]
MHIMTAILAGLTAITAAPVPAAAEPAVAPGDALQRTWWEYYDQGLRAVNRSEWEESIPHFEQAIRMHPESSSSARTYGMRYISYFPYFYVGVAYYNVGDVDKALELLQLEASKSKERTPDIERQLTFFLTAAEAAIEDRDAAIEAERQRLARERARADSIRNATRQVTQTPPVTPPPVVTQPPTPPPAERTTPARPAKPTQVVLVTPVASNEPVREPSIFVSGNAFAAPGVVEISLALNGQPWTSLEFGKGGGPPGTRPDGEIVIQRIADFNVKLEIAQLMVGTNRLVVTVKDAAGGTATDTREIRRAR